jgi:lipoprotein NlpI
VEKARISERPNLIAPQRFFRRRDNDDNLASFGYFTATVVILGRVMRAIIWAALSTTAIIWTQAVIGPAQAQTQTQQLIDQCANTGNAFSPAQRVDSCTALIESGKVFGQGLAWAYESRCAAYNDGKAGDYAIADCTQAILREPTVRGYSNRGNAYYAKGDNDNAIADYNQAIQLNPKDAAAFNNRGSAYFAKGNSDHAIADYSQAIQINPRDVGAYNNRGNAYYAKGDHERAIADYSQAIQIDPRNSRAYLSRGLANLYLGALPKTLNDLNQASALDPDDGYVALWLDIANKRGRSVSRLAKATSASDLTKWPGPIIRFYLGKMTAAELQAATEAPNSATKKAQVCEANFYSGEVALQQRKRDQAIQLFRLAAADCPKSFLEYSSANAELLALHASP